jgi:hypothetical protein
MSGIYQVYTIIINFMGIPDAPGVMPVAMLSATARRCHTVDS